MRNLFEQEIDRREFGKLLLKMGASALMAGVISPLSATAAAEVKDEPKGADNDFHFAQLTYRGGNWDPHPRAHIELLKEVELRTSVKTSRERVALRNMDERVFAYPSLYVTGKEEFEPFTDREVEMLRRFLYYGGFLLADDAAGHPGYDFDKSFRREMKRTFPDRELERLPRDHSVFRSYYLINFVGGSRIVNPYLEGINIEEVTPVIYCQNDLGSAWEKDPLGNWVHQVKPGGEAQRMETFKLGVNIILYTLTLDYKKDQIHIPFLQKKMG